MIKNAALGLFLLLFAVIVLNTPVAAQNADYTLRDDNGVVILMDASGSYTVINNTGAALSSTDLKLSRLEADQSFYVGFTETIIENGCTEGKHWGFHYTLDNSTTEFTFDFDMPFLCNHFGYDWQGIVAFVQSFGTSLEPEVCHLIISGTVSVNVRSTPEIIEGNIIAYVSNQTLPVGQTNEWWQVTSTSFDGSLVSGWVSKTVARISSFCGAIPFTVYP